MKWTEQKIENGLKRFHAQFGRYPTAGEIDVADDLPSSRTLLRRFGGVVGARERFGLAGAKDFSVGEYRAEQCRLMNVRSADDEKRIFDFLLTLVPPMMIRSQKYSRCDFFVYTTPSEGIAIDVFYAKDMASLKGCMRVKEKNKNHKKTILIVTGDNVTQEDIEWWIQGRERGLSPMITVMTEKHARKVLTKML